MKKRIFLLLLAVLLLSAAAAGCESSGEGESEKSEAKETVVIGGTSISQVFYDAIKDKYEAMGYKTEFRSFDSNQVVLEACASDEIDIAIGQHKKFVQSFDESNDADLDMVKPYGMYTGIGLYSEKYQSAGEFPKGAQIAVMNDAMNEDIALRILEDEGLIEIADGVELATVADITENPKNLEIVEMDQAQTVISLEDMAGACVFFTHMSAAEKDPADYIARDKVMINYPMGAIARAADIEADWAVAFAQCFRDEEVQQEIAEAYPDVFEFYTSDDQAEE